MKMLEKEKETFFEEARHLVEDYMEDRILLLRLQAGEQVAKLVSSLYIMFAIGLLLFIILLILTVIAGYFLSALTGNFAVGFGIVIIIYVVAIFVLYFMHRSFLGKYVTNAIIKLMFDKKDEPHAI